MEVAIYSIEEFIEKTNLETDADSVFSEFEKVLAYYGYDRICYSLITDHPSLGLSSGHGIFRNYPESWMKYYVEKGYDRVDPVPQYGLITNRPFTWDFVTNNLNISKAQRKVMDEAREAKLLDGVGLAIHGLNGEISGVGLASSTGNTDTDPVTLAKIRALVVQFHTTYTDLLQTNPAYNFITLTQREKEILSWASEGKSDGVIADILGISYSTVRFHTNNAYKKLGANDRVYAITKAIRFGLIHPSYVRTFPDKVAR